MFPVLSPEPQMVKDLVVGLVASSPALLSALDRRFFGFLAVLAQVRTRKQNSAKGARRIAFGREQSGG
jgi:hypothetical protein